MPLNFTDDTPTKFPQQQFLTLDNFKRGVITLIDKSRLPKNALEEANNLFLYEDGQPGPRPGVNWFGTAPGAVSAASPSQSPSSSQSPSASASTSPSASLSPSSSTSISPSSSRSPSASTSISPSASTSMSPSASLSPSSSVSPSASASASPSAGDYSDIDGVDYFDFNGVVHLVAASGGTIYRSTDDATTWTACTGARYTSGTTVNMNQYNSYLYITNGVDAIIRYDGSTVLTQYTDLATPAAPTVVETGTGLTSGTSYQYYYKCSRVNTIGFSTASAASTVIQTGLAREDWTAGKNYATLTLPALAGTQTRYDVYVSENDLDYYYLGSTSTVTFVDDGTGVVVPSTTAPTASTATGPLVEELTNVGSRMYGVRDTANRHRIWFSSGQPPYGAFSGAYDGGYLDWDSGGKFTPVKVADYRDGKGTPLATVWCKSADGQGCIIQMSLDILTVGDVSITVPSAYKLPGSRGTPAPGSVVNVLNDFMFYNSQAFYNLGSRAQFLNLLSTDESSANIRPTVKQISTSGESGIASVYFDAKVYFSVGYGSSSNNYTAVYDTERKAWLPKAFTLGFKKFLRYTDTAGNNRLLALGVGDSVLSEISSNYTSDYGVAFTTSLATGLYPTTKNRFEFQWTEEGEIELSNPQGTINVELVGIERSQGFSTTNSEAITSTTTTTGHSTYLHSTTIHSDTSTAIDTFSESSIKRYFPVQKELNAVQCRITTNTIDARYVLRTLQTSGTDTQGGKPRAWKL